MQCQEMQSKCRAIAMQSNCNARQMHCKANALQSKCIAKQTQCKANAMRCVLESPNKLIIGLASQSVSHSFIIIALRFITFKLLSIHLCTHYSFVFVVHLRDFPFPGCQLDDCCLLDAGFKSRSNEGCLV
jgi:hypothetical protein